MILKIDFLRHAFAFLKNIMNSFIHIHFENDFFKISAKINILEVKKKYFYLYYCYKYSYHVVAINTKTNHFQVLRLLDK